MLGLLLGAGCFTSQLDSIHRTQISIAGENFHLNGQPTYAGRVWHDQDIQGLLLNSRMVQGIFDDRNPDTVKFWAYPDTGRWDAERNTREFLAAMPEWRRHGLLAFTINLQGGSPQGYSKDQPWHNSAFESDGSLRADYLARLERILNKADELGMAVILGCFYFGQDERLKDEAAVLRATDNATNWLLDRGWRNVLVEVNNECNVAKYDHALLKPDRVHELIERVKRTTRDGRRLLVGTSYGGGKVPGENVVRASDFLLMHGNGVKNPDRIAEMVRQARLVPGYTPKPILFNEDDHFDFDQPRNNFIAALSEHASWGCFDFRMAGEGFDDGYQSVPVNWGISSGRKRGFFGLLADITGARPAGAGKISVHPVNYHGWPGSYILSNGRVEAAVVPAVGRVMQFRFAGESDGPFWENRALDGKAPDPQAREWGNFGGDKTWPAPQASWPKITPRSWPPPPGFDSMPVAAEVNGNGVTLVSPVDPFFGIRTHRRIRLEPAKAVMTIVTTYEKVSGDPQQAAVWIITQFQEPAGVFIPVPKVSKSAPGYTVVSKEAPPGLKVENDLLSLTRDPRTAHKIGNDAGTLLWVGEKTAVRIDAPRLPDREYTHSGNSAEVYTNPDPLPYVELELLGPLHTMKSGDRISQTNTYTLFRRTEASAGAEARKILQR